MGYIAVALSFVVPYFAIPVALVARQHIRAAYNHSTPVEWWWILSIPVITLLVLIIVGGFIASVALPTLS